MKKLIPLLVLLGLLVTVIGASAYDAVVSINVLADSGDTQDAELSMTIKPNRIARNFLGYNTTLMPGGRGAAGYGTMVEANFKGVQRQSIYTYVHVLEIDNKKPYSIHLGVSKISGVVGSFGKIKLEIIACDGNTLLGTFDDGVWNPSGNSVVIGPDPDTVPITFRLTTFTGALPGALRFGVVFHGHRP